MGRLYVGNIPWSMTEEQLRDYFSEHAPVVSVTIVTDRETGRSRGFGFVELEGDASDSLIESTNGQEFGGRNLRVDRAQERSRGPRR